MKGKMSDFFMMLNFYIYEVNLRRSFYFMKKPTYYNLPNYKFKVISGIDGRYVRNRGQKCNRRRWSNHKNRTGCCRCRLPDTIFSGLWDVAAGDLLRAGWDVLRLPGSAGLPGCHRGPDNRIAYWHKRGGSESGWGPGNCWHKRFFNYFSVLANPKCFPCTPFLSIPIQT